jgi:hypothetical protein
MLFMVVERFKHNNPSPVGERFKSRGRMLPPGVTYQASWMETSGSECFQLMEAPTPEALNEWIVQWNDLVDFGNYSGRFLCRVLGSHAEHIAIK